MKLTARTMLVAASLLATVATLGCMLLGAGAAMFSPGALASSPTPFLPAVSTPTAFLPNLATQLAPFLEETPGASSLESPTPPSGSPPWAPFAGPVYAAPTAIPSPAQPFELGQEVMNIALLGSDIRPQGGSFRTDTIIILSLNRAKGTATMISFPRDLFVYIPGYTMQRINVAFPVGVTLNYPRGSFGLFQDTMMYNFGLPVQHWLSINFGGFTSLVNSLGGIDVPVSQAFSDYRKGPGIHSVSPGIVHMDGATALWYVRARYSTNDFDRTRRQQEVMIGFANRLLSLNAVGNLPGFFSQLQRYVNGDLSFQNLVPYLGLVTTVRPSNVRQFRIVSPTQCYGWTTSGGADVELPLPAAIRSLLQQALYP